MMATNIKKYVSLVTRVIATAIAIQACRSCSRALDAVAAGTCDIHNA